MSKNGDRIRAAIADLRGELDPKDWEATAARTMKQIWLTDCMSVYQSLTRSTMAKMSDKRLSIEIASLRQSLWRLPGEAQGDDRTMDDIPKETTDKCRWIDTDVMLADPLTKVMEPWKLDEALDTNYWSLKQPIDSIMKKRAKQLQRRKTKDEMTILPTVPEEEVTVDHFNDYQVVEEAIVDEEELITDQEYQYAYYSNRSTSSVFMNLYEVQDVQQDTSLKCWTRFDYNAFTHKTSMNGGPSWKDVKYRITTDLDQNLILSKERVSHDAQYDWHSVLPGNVRRNIRTDLYSYIDLDKDDGFSICS